MNNNTRLAIIVVFLWALTAVAFGQANQWGPYDPGAVRKTDQAARVDTINASFTGSIDVTGNVGAAKVSAAAYDTEDGDLLDMMAMINSYNPKRWGIRIEKANSNPDTRVTYLYDAVGMTPAAMNFASGTFNYGDWKPFCDAINRPVMLDAAGNVVEVLDPNDQTKKIDGTASSISSTTHALNAMSEFKRLWLRTYEDDDYQYIIFSNVQYDENYHANAFTAADGTIRDRMYYAMFEGSNVSSKLRSIATGATMINQTAATEIAYAETNGAGWHINYKSQRDFITYLLALISKSTNSQAVFGQGNSNSAASIAPGALKATGRFWGDDAATDQAVKVFFIEHFWGNYWKRCAGLLLRNDAGTAKIYVKHTPTYNETADSYIDTGVTPGGTSEEYIKAMNSAHGALIPATNTGGSASTFFMDGFWFATPAAAGNCHYALVGAYRGNAGLCGAFAVFLRFPLSDAGPYLGARLSFLKP